MIKRMFGGVSQVFIEVALGASTLSERQVMRATWQDQTFRTDEYKKPRVFAGWIGRER